MDYYDEKAKHGSVWALLSVVLIVVLIIMAVTFAIEAILDVG